MTKEESIAFELLEWFQQNQREFPWRENRSPYAVLVSEIMLQQTQARRVIPYFLRWMNKYPSIQALAAAAEEDVIHLWEGLGYYSRARSLLKAARYIVDHFNGTIPSTKEALLQVPGIGPYTVGALLSFGFLKPTPAVDANVLRVISRLYDINDIVTKQHVRRNIEQIVENILKSSKTDGSTLMESLIEFGALICTSGVAAPSCSLCPLKDVCASYQKGVVQQRPVCAPKAKTKILHRVVFIFYIRAKDQILIVKRSGKKIMAGLHEFPFVELEANEVIAFFDKGDSEYAMRYARNYFNVKCNKRMHLPLVSHGFTRYIAKLYPVIIEIDEPFTLKEVAEDEPVWIHINQIETLPFSSGHKRVYQDFLIETHNG